MRFESKIAAAATAFLLATTPILAQGANSPPQKSEAGRSAATFVTKAGNGGLFEVESSKLALQKAQRADVKAFAQQMIDDHGKANQELMAEAQKAGVGVPDKLDTPHQARLAKLSAANGPAFDRAYLNAQATAHREAVALFGAYAKTGSNADLKQFASRTLPIIEGHMTKLKQIDKTSASNKTSTSNVSGTDGKSAPSTSKQQ